MKVLKFGGTSVANSKNILLVEKIIKDQSKKNPLIAVVSALSSVTDELINAAEKASKKEEKYVEIIKDLEDRLQRLLENK